MTTTKSARDTPVHSSAYGCITLPFLLLAAITLAWGGRTQWMAGELARIGDVVPAQVIELRFVASNPAVVQQSSRGGQARGESPVVTFTTGSGEKRTAIGSVNRRPAPWAVGDTVDVAYDPADPARADLVSEISTWRWWFGLWCIVAMVFAAVASIPVVLRLRYSRGNQVDASS